MLLMMKHERLMFIAHVDRFSDWRTLYADDILILSPTVCKLQEMLNAIECELQALDLTINSKKNPIAYVSVLDAT